MRKLVYLANPFSPHVRQWLEIFSNINIEDINEVEIYHIKHLDGGIGNVSEQYEYVRSYCPIPGSLSWLPAILQYVYLGVYLKFTLANSSLIHAHNSSGYGLSAFLSGKKYILTTYGSEVYRATLKNINLPYKILIKAILGSAEIITSSSSQMTDSLNDLCMDLNVYEFSLGVSREFHYSQSLRDSAREKLKIPLGAVVIFSNRRLTRLYNIDIILEAFKNVSKERKLLYLIQIEGDADLNYSREIDKNFNVENLLYIKGFLEQSELNEILCASDYTISLPVTDQLSSSILEGISCNCLPILSNLKAYKPLGDISITVDASVKNLEKTIFDVLDGKYDNKYELVEEFTKRYSIDVAAKKYQDVLEKFNV